MQGVTPPIKPVAGADNVFTLLEIISKPKECKKRIEDFVKYEKKALDAYKKNKDFVDSKTKELADTESALTKRSINISEAEQKSKKDAKASRITQRGTRRTRPNSKTGR